MLLTMFYLINERMNGIDEVSRLVHQNYVIIQIRRKLRSIRESTAITLLLPTMFSGIDKSMNQSDDL